jgi:Outer membrane protein beta-barrel domain
MGAVLPETELLMMKRMWRQGLRYSIVVAVAAAIFSPAPAQAQITRVSSSSSDKHNAVGITVGGFFLKPLDSRVNDDVLLIDHDSLAFDIKDFNGPSVSGEWLIGFGNFLEGGLSAGYYQRAVPSVYLKSVNENGSEIAQELKLRVVPFTATVRFLPIGHGSVEPYVGAGIAALRWRYSEVGQFIDFDDVIFNARYVANGTAFGPVILGGIRFPFADTWDIGGEVRYQKAEGDTKPANSELLGGKIDLGGWNAALTFHVRF